MVRQGGETAFGPSSMLGGGGAGAAGAGRELPATPALVGGMVAYPSPVMARHRRRVEIEASAVPQVARANLVRIFPVRLHRRLVELAVLAVVVARLVVLVAMALSVLVVAVAEAVAT